MSTSEFVKKTIRPEVQALKAYPVSPPWSGIKIELMEDNHFDLGIQGGDAIRTALGEALAKAAFNRYPDPSAPQLKAKLRSALNIPEKHALLLGSGSDEIIALLSQAILTGATALGLEPSFSVFKHAALNAGGRFVGVPLKADFSLDLAATLTAIEQEQPKLVWVVFPNNPTGNIYADDAVEAIIRAAPGLVVIDEAYEPFTGGRSWMSRLDEFPNVVVMRTLSKIGLAGVRLGYLIGSPEWVSEIDKVRGPFNVGVLQQVAAEVLLGHYDVLKTHAALMVAGRERLFSALKQLPGVTPFPSSTNFVLARFPDSAYMYEALKSRGILVRNLSALHPLMANTLRLSVGTEPEMDALLAALTEILDTSVK